MNIENKSNNNDFNTSKQLGQNKQETSIIDETMQETIELSILYDFYGELLTDNNKEVFVEYIFNDLSLAEIADEKGITRQGIHDIIKRSSKKLREYEESLHLVKKFKSIEEKVNNIKGIIEELRLEMYPQIQDNDEDKQYFDNKLFSLQSQLRELATTAGLLEYK